MNTEGFLNRAIMLVKEATNYEYEPQIVWYNYTLGNIKCMLIIPSPDNYYYEVTYNRDKNEMYFDKYKKIEHKVFELNE